MPPAPLPTQLDQLEFMELMYGPQAESYATQYRHPGTEMVLVLDGLLGTSPLLVLQLSLDHVGVSDFAASLLLLR